MKPGWLTPYAYLELHIEQGPILEDEGLVIAAVEGITGLAWTEVAITGRASHAGTTPMHLRRDAAYAAYHHFELASAAVQIAIVLASASIITQIVALAWVAGGLGAIAVAFCVIGFWFPAAVHLF